MTFEEDHRTKTLADMYGLDHQLDKLCEECEELDSAIVQQKIDPCAKNKWAVVCEMADVIFLIRQVLYKFAIRPEAIDAVITYKYERQLARVRDRQNEEESS